ncbi:hAT transposon family protein, partial [Escherichia coli]
SPSLLALVAVALLSVCPTEASVERAFSVQKMIHRPSRNRLHNDVIQAEMMIKFNYNTLNIIMGYADTPTNTHTDTSSALLEIDWDDEVSDDEYM